MMRSLQDLEAVRNAEIKFAIDCVESKMKSLEVKLAHAVRNFNSSNKFISILDRKLAVAIDALNDIKDFDVKTGGLYPGTAKRMCGFAAEALAKIEAIK